MAHLVGGFILSVFMLLGRTPDICGFVTLDQSGVTYDGGSQIFPARIFTPFPWVYINADGSVDSLPRSTEQGVIPMMVLNDEVYRNIRLEITLRPYTPDFLLPYIASYWDSWGERLPYVGEWQLTYEVGNGLGWVEQGISGEITPACLPGVDASLLADADFNGNPSAFWNNHTRR